MDVRNRLTNEIITVPFSLIHQGINGTVVVDDLGEGNRIYFKYGVETDIANDGLETFTHISMAGFYSLDLTITDPEGTAPDEPTPTLNCALHPLVQSNPSKTYSNGKNTFRLYPLVGGTLQFATEVQGIAKAGSEIVGITYYTKSKESDGSYLIEVNATGAAETILIRQQGCTSTVISPSTNDFYGGKFHAYITDDSGVIIPPSSTKVEIPIGAFRWDGFYEDYLLNPRQAIDGSYYDQGINQTTGSRLALSEFSSINAVPFFGEQGLAPESVPIITDVQWNPSTESNDLTIVYKDVTCRFNLTPTAMIKEIGYAKDGGIDFWAFLWYSPYDSPMAEAFVKFIALSSTDKQGMKMCFASGPVGWEVANNMTYIATQMRQSYYQQIDGKPLFFATPDWFDTSFSNGKSRLDLLKDEYSAQTGGGQIYVAAQEISNTYPNIAGTNASNCYSFYPDETAGSGLRPHSEVITYEMQRLATAPADKDIIPTLSTGMFVANFRNSLANPIFPRWYDKASGSDWTTKFNNIITFIQQNPVRCKALMFYSWNENAESGNPICPTLSPGTTNVNVSTVNVSGATTGVNRSTLDYIKAYCKK